MEKQIETNHETTKNIPFTLRFAEKPQQDAQKVSFSSLAATATSEYTTGSGTNGDPWDSPMPDTDE
jgi:hypothetical protein